MPFHLLPYMTCECVDRCGWCGSFIARRKASDRDVPPLGETGASSVPTRRLRGRVSPAKRREAFRIERCATVAIYYLNVQIIGRRAGRTATGSAAYRAGERIVDERTGRVLDYTRRRQGEIETEIMALAGAPEWAHRTGP